MKLSQVLIGIVAAAGAIPAYAQAPGTPAARPAAERAVVGAAATPEAARQAAMDAAEDLALTRVIAGLRLTRSQMETLLPVLEAAQAKLKAQEEAAQAALAGPQPLLEETRRALIAGKNPSTRAEGQIAEQARLQAGKLRQLRADLVSGLRRTLNSVLSANQQPLLAQTARTLNFQQRSARFLTRGATGGGRGNGGPVGWMGRALDRVRGASEANYAEERMRIAMRLSGMGDGRGRDRGAQEQAAPSPTDPQVQQRMAPLLALIDRTRQMPDAQYRQSRDDLALQIWSKRAEAGFGPEMDENPEEAINALLDRYFLSPRMIPLMRERLASRPQGEVR